MKKISILIQNVFFRKSCLALLVCHTISINLSFAIGMEINYNVRYANLPSHLKFDVNTAQPLLKMGYIDVTKAPYNATGNGVTDDWQAIQNAVNDARNYNFVAFFPANKIYLISKQIDCVNRGTEGSRKFGFQLVGSTLGNKPIIRLIDNSPVISNNILINYDYFDTSPKSSTDPTPFGFDASRHYMGTFRGIDVDMGSGVNNNNTSALSMDGAQYCLIEDVKISGTNFYAGIHKLPGSGGGVINVKVIGGQIGILQDEYRPNPTIFGLELINQSLYGIRITNSRGPLIIAGFKIIGPANPSSNYRAISSVLSTFTNVVNGIVDHGMCNLALTDGRIEVSGSAPAIDNSAQDVTMINVYFKAAQIIHSGASGGGNSVPFNISGNASVWYKIANYAFTSRLDKSTIFDNVNLNTRLQNFQYPTNINLIVEEPTLDFTILHSWQNTTTNHPPSFEDTRVSPLTGLVESNIIDITVGITINGVTYRATTEEATRNDDWLAIQTIIDQVTNPNSQYFGMTVFIPRGFFLISKTLQFKNGLKMIGSSKGNSCILPLTDWVNTVGPMVSTDDVVNGSLYLSDFGLVVYPHQQTLLLRTPNSFIRDLLTESVADKAFKNCRPTNIQGAIPYFRCTGNAGGRIYNLVTDQIAGNCDDPSNTYVGTAGSDYNFLVVENTKNPLTFYHASIEHLDNTPQTRFRNAKNITVYGFKYESKQELLEINNCDSILLVGGSGNYSIISATDRAIIVIIKSSNVLIQNFNRKEYSETGLFPVNTKWIFYDGNLVSGDFGISLFRYTSPSILPIELASISARAFQNRSIMLDWASTIEVNTRLYEILRSTDGVNFSKIADVSAAANSNITKEYQYIDNAVLPGFVYYYRLKVVDKDGKFSNTKIVNAQLYADVIANYVVYPNPTKDVIQIDFKGTLLPNGYLVIIKNLLGQEVMRLKLVAQKTIVATKDWGGAGIYLVNITNSNGEIISTKKVTKQ